MDMGAKDKLRHKAEELKGRAKKSVGHATDDERLRDKGRTDQARGSMKQAGEKIKDAGKKVKGAFKK
ncbi:CsbD family protein [Nonomuraea sp. CA-141351]|uniref:CsbD family protein n=1 Tax=Nonomuraea sp. CA-141351 TaxID=3239996 RepID=UPI003D917C09